MLSFPGMIGVEQGGEWLSGVLMYEGNTAQLRLRISADLLRHFCSSKNGKYIQYSPIFETLNWHKISR